MNIFPVKSIDSVKTWPFSKKLGINKKILRFNTQNKFLTRKIRNQMHLDSLFLFNFTTISSYFKPVDVDIVPQNFAQIVADFVHTIGNISGTVSAHAFSPIHFTELQTILLTIFLVIFSINLALIGVYWQKYGGVITDRFIRPSMYTNR